MTDETEQPAPEVPTYPEVTPEPEPGTDAPEPVTPTYPDGAAGVEAPEVPEPEPEPEPDRKRAR